MQHTHFILGINIVPACLTLAELSSSNDSLELTVVFSPRVDSALRRRRGRSAVAARQCGTATTLVSLPTVMITNVSAAVTERLHAAERGVELRMLDKDRCS